jgi:hypothetical protein
LLGGMFLSMDENDLTAASNRFRPPRQIAALKPVEET